MNRMKKILVLLPFFVVGILNAQVKLSFNPTQGKTYEYSYGMEQQMAMEVGGSSVPVNMNMEVIYDMKVLENSPEAIVVESAYRAIIISGGTQGMDIQYDSRKSGQDTAGDDNVSAADKSLDKFIGGMLNKSFTVRLLPDGTVSSVSGFDEILKGLDGAAGSDLQTSAMLKQAYNEESLKNMFEQSFKIYPKQAVRQGDDWDVEMKYTAAGMDGVMKSNYRLKSLDQKTALLDVVSDLNFTKMAVIDGGLNGKQTGEMLIERATGMPVKFSSVLDLGGNMQVQGMDFKLSSKAKITVLQKEVK